MYRAIAPAAAARAAARGRRGRAAPRGIRKGKGRAPPTRCSGVALRVARLDQNRHDTGSTTARSVDEVALIRDTISYYAPVLIAPLSIRIRRAGIQKKLAIRGVLSAVMNSEFCERLRVR